MQYQVVDRQKERANIEAQYIACLIQDNSLIEEATLSPEVFQEREHSAFYKLIDKFRKKDLVFDFTSLAILSDRELASIGGVNYMRQVCESLVSISQFKYYEKMIHSFYVQAETRDSAISFVQDMSHSPSDDRVAQYIQEVQRIETATTKPTDNFKAKLYQQYQKHQDSPLEGLTGVDTGSQVLNKITDGWQRKDLIVIGARPSMGKTLVGLGTLIKGEQNDPDIMPTFMSAEMAVGGIIDRCIANIGGLDLSKLRNFNKYVQSDNDRARYNKALGVLEHSNFDVYEENTMPAIRARMRQRIKQHPDKKHVCCIDFLTQLRPVNPTGNANTDYGDIVLDAKQMAKDLDIPVILLVQLNRQNEARQDKRPSMGDIRDTGTVEQAADVIGFIHRDDYYERDREPNNILEFNIAKNRQGGTGQLKFKVDLKTQNFFDIAR